MFILLLSDGSTVKSVCTHSLNVSLFHLSQFPVTRYWSLKKAKKIYAYGWKIFLCYSLIFAWEKYSEKFQKYNCAPRELNYIFETFLWRLLSISNIAFSIWSELRVLSCLANTKPRHKDSYEYATWCSVASREVCMQPGCKPVRNSQVSLIQGNKEQWILHQKTVSYSPNSGAVLSLSFLPCLFLISYNRRSLSSWHSCDACKPHAWKCCRDDQVLDNWSLMLWWLQGAQVNSTQTST